MDAELRPTAVALASVLACAIASMLACDADDPLVPRGATLPDVEFCDEVREWSAESTAIERELLDVIASARADAHDCGALGRAAPSDPPRLDGALGCAARVHAIDMAAREYFGHDDPDGRLPWHRIADVGYPTVLATELIAMGELEPQALVEDLWLPSAPHCGALLASEWIDIGIAHHALPEPPADPDAPAPTWWVVVLAVPDTRR